jgi:hypothetical protein
MANLHTSLLIYQSRRPAQGGEEERTEMSDILLMTIGVLFGIAFAGELCCYFSTPWWFRAENRLLGFIPLVGGFLLYRKYKKGGRGRG